jgi:hypothetical protein
MRGLKPIRFDPEQVDRAYDKYVENCRRLGVEPMSCDRVQVLAAEWLKALGTAPSNDKLDPRCRGRSRTGH